MTQRTPALPQHRIAHTAHAGAAAVRQQRVVHRPRKQSHGIASGCTVRSTAAATAPHSTHSAHRQQPTCCSCSSECRLDCSFDCLVLTSHRRAAHAAASAPTASYSRAAGRARARWCCRAHCLALRLRSHRAGAASELAVSYERAADAPLVQLRPLMQLRVRPLPRTHEPPACHSCSSSWLLPSFGE